MKYNSNRLHQTASTGAIFPPKGARIIDTTLHGPPKYHSIYADILQFHGKGSSQKKNSEMSPERSENGGKNKVEKHCSICLKNKDASQCLSHFPTLNRNSKPGYLFLNSIKCMFLSIDGSFISYRFSAGQSTGFRVKQTYQVGKSTKLFMRFAST